MYYKFAHEIEQANEKEIPDLLYALGPLRSCQALYHGEENPLNACTQLC